MRPARKARRQKLPAFLITSDDSLWPQIGADLPENLILRQVDSIDELLSSTPSGHAAVLLWDARHQSERSQALSRLNLHSPRFVVIALDEAGGAGAWTLPLQHRQVNVHIAVPISGSALSKALDNATEEVLAREALLGEAADLAAAPDPQSGSTTKFPVLPVAVGGVLLIGAIAYLLTRHEPVGKPAANVQASLAGAAKAQDGNEEKLDSLIEKAQQAMAERHFIDPANGSALALYRDALLIDPANGEVRQGLLRLAEVLITRVQSALDDRKFDVALQSLETARSIDPTDKRLPGFDEKIATLRSELGPAQIMATINAQNFDRALQLIDDAARAKTLSATRLAQLRDEVRRHREDFDQTRLLKLADTRVQQDRLIEPRNDSAAYYLDQARQAGAPAADVQAQLQELQHHLIQDTRAAIDQRRYADADRWLAEMHNVGVAPTTTNAIQHDLAAARSAIAAAKTEQPQAADLVQARLAQGRLNEPENDSALFYLAQLRAADPRNAVLPALSAQAQGQLTDLARAALEGGDLLKTDALLQQAKSLGPSPEADALAERLRQKTVAADEMPLVPEQSLTRLEKLEINYPYRALQGGVEGWVELGYTVKADGAVSAIKVLGTSPAGTFDLAATRAVAKLRYQPVLRDGKPTPVGTQIRVTFRIPK